MDTPAPSAALETVEQLCVSVGALERSVERRLLSVLWGAEPSPLSSPGEASMLVHVALHGARSPGGGVSALSSIPKADRLVAALSHQGLSPLDVDAARGVDSLALVRAVIQHPECSPSTVVRMSQAAWSFGASTPVAVSAFLSSASGPYGRASALLGRRCAHLGADFFVTLGLEAGGLPPAALEVFSTLMSELPDTPGHRSGDLETFSAVSALIDQARLVIE